MTHTRKPVNLLINYLVFILVLFYSCKEEAIILYPPDDTVNPEVVYPWEEIADSLQQTTNEIYRSTDGRYYKQNEENNTFHYWWNAHMLDVLVDGYQRTENENYIQRMRALLDGMKETNDNTYPNHFYDDMEWLALSSLRAYQVSNDEAFLQATSILWDDIQTGLNDYQGGGIAWKKDQLDYKNTPANAPAIILACRLYTDLNNEQDLTLAQTLYEWLKSTLVDPANGIVWDGINRNGDGEIDKNWLFTYNQGVFIGAAHELYKVTGDRTYLNDAVRTANTAISHPDITVGGILKNENQGDGGLFKGIMIRYLALLAEEQTLTDADRIRFQDFIKFNAETAYTKALSRPALLFGPNWEAQPDETVDLSTQLSGVMLIEAAARLSAQ
ncbi:glycosyl hydrolase [Olivibacter sp. SDN3]|uniref:glycoside hydrolase family 76 protein n=1 Tax=Olivibacter sp. SDN3 TaxID=2764720 RepID=UPI0016513FAE|nr:glycoside hydrolase family 76 protein [Olivibacter sp. SDN3]QNL49372.1 glycosyl hydrolase [Olivibacter sp. SDN3]